MQDKFTEIIPASLQQNHDAMFKDDIADLFLGLKTAHLASHTFQHGAVLWEDFFNKPSDYYVVRDEITLIGAHAGDIRKICAGTRNVIDLGPGSTGAVERKTLPILKSLSFSAERYIAVDVSEAYLAGAGRTVAGEFPRLDIKLICKNFFTAPRLAVDERSLALLLGVTISNMPGIHDKETGIQFLRDELKIFRKMLPTGAHFLCSYDTCQDGGKLMRAYDHPKHAKFIESITDKIKTDLLSNSDFDAAAWIYKPRWDQANHMFKHILVSTKPMSFSLGGHAFMLPAGYEILSYVSVKFPEEIYLDIFSEAGFELAAAPFKGPDGDINIALLRAV